MPVTPVYKIPSPDGTTSLVPLSEKFTAIADAVESALLTGLGGAPLLANSDAQRNSLVPSPVQGNLVMRPDLGWMEQYYETYDPTTNAGGATPAGWYPVKRQGPMAQISKSISQNVTSSIVPLTFGTVVRDPYGMYTTSQNTRLYSRYTGFYQVTAKLMQSNVAATTIQAYKNGGIIYGLNGAETGASGAAANPLINGFVTLNAGDYVDIRVSGASGANQPILSVNNQTWFSLEYVDRPV